MIACILRVSWGVKPTGFVTQVHPSAPAVQRAPGYMTKNARKTHENGEHDSKSQVSRTAYFKNCSFESTYSFETSNSVAESVAGRNFCDGCADKLAVPKNLGVDRKTETTVHICRVRLFQVEYGR